MSPKKTMRKAHYATTKDARVLQSRESLKEALLKLLKKQPFNDITIREITDLAGVGYNTFFRHHSSKDELLKDIAAEEIQNLISLSLAAFDGVNTKQAAQAVCGYVAKNRTLWSALLAGGAIDALREEFIRLSRLESETSLAGKQSIPGEIGVLLVASSTIELLAWWLRQPKRISVEELSDIYEELVVTPTIRIYNK